MSVSKVDQAIMVIKFMLDEQREKVKDLEKRSDLTEGQKVRIADHYKLSRSVETLIETFKKTIKANLGKLPPQVPDFERSVLGKIMLHSLSTEHAPSGIAQVRSFLLPEHFYTETHQEIYRACLEIDKQNRIIDMKSVVWQLRQNKTIELVGGSHYIAELTSVVSSTHSVEWEARLIVEQAIKRELILICSRVTMDAYEDNSDYSVLLDRGEEEFKRVRSWIKE